MATNTNVPDAASFAAPVTGLNITPATVLGAASATVVGLIVAKATPHVEKPQQFNDSLYNVYCNAYQTSRQLWEVLDKKYKLEDVGTKKFLMGKFLDFKMVDTKLVVNQMEELQIIISDLHSEGIVINEPFQVAVVIEKLSHSWKDFKNYLKRKRKELSMEDLALRLCIEEDNRKGDKISHKFEARANIVEASAAMSQLKKQQAKKKSKHLGPKNNTANKRIQGSCWVCGKTGYRAIDCRHKKGQSSGNN
ncbi:uncharacterized protein LOC127808592 [Diospyros lotus]|uniref:uncharacterized protein LOC127808592 n=1 Tax=Diospyros lotus TaxID=55363 RepID=UPI00225ADC21|nr:uncharacterized protein LOC127808592 [Diospyros lotus]